MDTTPHTQPGLIRDPDEYDYYPDPDDMSLTEAGIVELINQHAGEISTIDAVIRRMVQDFLFRCGIMADEDSIGIDVFAMRPSEGITYITEPRSHVRADVMAQHINGPTVARCDSANGLTLRDGTKPVSRALTIRLFEVGAND